MEAESSRALARIIKACTWTLVALVVLKFVVLLAEFEWDPSKAPWGLLIVIALPALALTVLINRRPRPGGVVAALVFALFAATVVAALVRDGLARQAWADYPFAYGGLLVAVVGIISAVKLWRAPRTTEPPASTPEQAMNR